MSKVRIDYDIILHSPLHIGTGEGFAGIIDKKTLSHKQADKRLPIVFGHSIKGIMKDEFQKLHSIIGKKNDYLEQLFGTAEQQGSLFFSPWKLNEDLKKSLDDKTNLIFDVKAGNQIVRGRRVAKSEHLFTHEMVQNHLLLEGDITGTMNESATIDGLPESLFYLLFSLYSIKRIGGKRRSGLGSISIRVKKVEVDDAPFNEKQIKQKLDNNINSFLKGAKISG